MKPRDNRVLFNGDVNFLWNGDYRPHGDTGPYTTRVLDNYVDILADNGVDTFIINVNAQVPWYPSKALPNVLTGYTRGNRDFVRGQYPPTGPDFTEAQLNARLDSCTTCLDRYLDLVDAGVDWVAHYAVSCRRRGLHPWASIRMNDAHGANGWATSYMNCPPQRDPKLRLTGRRINPKNPSERFLTVCNYEHAEVRHYYLTMIREIINDYDYEGIELDWLRMPLCCEPPASRRALDLMIAFHGEVRQLAAARAKATGRPYHVGLRVPARLGALRTMGVDVEAIAREGFIDFIAPSNFWQTTWNLPYDRMRQLVGDDVAIFGVIEDAPNWMFAQNEDASRRSYRLLSTSKPLVWANAAGKLATGVDGIEYYNFFCSDEKLRKTPGKIGADYAAIPGTADLHLLRGRTKHYALPTTFLYWSPVFFEHAGQIPTAIETGSWKNFEFAMAAEPDHPNLQLIAQIVIEKTDAAPDLGVSINGSWPTFDATPTRELIAPTSGLTHHVPQYLALNYNLPLDLVRDGFNELTVYDGSNDHSPDPTRKVTLTRIISVELLVKPRQL